MSSPRNQGTKPVKTLGPRAGVIDLGAPLVGVTLLRFVSPCWVRFRIQYLRQRHLAENACSLRQLFIGQNVALLDADSQIPHLGDRSERTFRLSQCVSGTMDLRWKLGKRIGSWKHTNLVARNCSNCCSL